MKKLLAPMFLLVLGLTLLLSQHLVEAQRGDLYGARAIQSLEQLLNADGVIGAFTVAGDLTLTGSLLLPAGTVGAPSLAWVDDVDGTGTGLYRPGANVVGIASDGLLVLQIATTVRGRDGTVGNAAYGFLADGDNGMYRPGLNNLGFTVGGALVVDIENTNAAGASADLLTISSTLGIMDGGADVVRGLFVDITSVDHTGGNIYGLDVDAIVADDDAVEAAARLNASWDYALFVDGTTQDFDHGLTTAVMLSPTLAANDNANDQRNILTIDVDIPDGSAGLINAINVDAVTDDPNTIDSAIFVEGGWDSAITITDAGHAFTSNPLTGSVYITLDDSTDYSGAGGVDCWLVLRDAGGNNHQIVEVVLNGACP